MNDLKNIKFGKLLVVRKVGRKHTYALWECKCDCGKITIVTSYRLTTGHTKSCGCLHRTHGYFNTRTYTSWYNMLARCNNPNRNSYKYYGERGIKVCAEWNNFKLFLNDMGERPAGKTLDRIDSNKDYYKENCRWATPREQNLNRRKYKHKVSGRKRRPMTEKAKANMRLAWLKRKCRNSGAGCLVTNTIS